MVSKAWQITDNSLGYTACHSTAYDANSAITVQECYKTAVVRHAQNYK